MLNNSPECDKSFGKNQKLIQKSIVKILPIVYSSMDKKHEGFLSLLDMKI